MKKIAIYGAGGLGRETALLIQQINMHSNKWELLGFFDDGLKKGEKVNNWTVIGGMDEVAKVDSPLDLVVAIADSQARMRVVEKIYNRIIEFPTLVHPTCLRGDGNNTFGNGCILSAGVILTTGISLGKFTIVNLQTTIGHDVKMGAFVTVMPGCSISGNVQIGPGSMIGTGARILQNLRLGSLCKVGAGAVVTSSFTDGKIIVGIPAHEK
ncbi:MAG: acetyltransferase [Cytophagales bacterium]|nr:acetyltransferase [Cytophagales bacterium]